MQLSKKQKKYAHALINGFTTGLLSGISLMAQSSLPTSKKAFIAFGLGVLGAGIARAAGHVLDAMNTTDSPNA